MLKILFLLLTLVVQINCITNDFNKTSNIANDENIEINLDNYTKFISIEDIKCEKNMEIKLGDDNKFKLIKYDKSNKPITVDLDTFYY